MKENQALSNKKISELENELNATKVLLEAQIKKFIRLERSSEACQQHGRGWNVEIDGIPANVGDDPEQIQQAVLKLFEAINVDIEDYEIDTVHRLPSRTSPKPGGPGHGN